MTLSEAKEQGYVAVLVYAGAALAVNPIGQSTELSAMTELPTSTYEIEQLEEIEQGLINGRWSRWRVDEAERVRRKLRRKLSVYEEE